MRIFGRRTPSPLHAALITIAALAGKMEQQGAQIEQQGAQIEQQGAQIEDLEERMEALEAEEPKEEQVR